MYAWILSCWLWKILPWQSNDMITTDFEIRFVYCCRGSSLLRIVELRNCGLEKLTTAGNQAWMCAIPLLHKSNFDFFTLNKFWKNFTWTFHNIVKKVGLAWQGLLVQNLSENIRHWDPILLLLPIMHLKIANNKIEGWADLENKCPEEMTARHVYSVTINFGSRNALHRSCSSTIVAR